VIFFDAVSNGGTKKLAVASMVPAHGALLGRQEVSRRLAEGIVLFLSI